MRQPGPDRTAGIDHRSILPLRGSCTNRLSAPAGIDHRSISSTATAFLGAAECCTLPSPSAICCLSDAVVEGGGQAASTDPGANECFNWNGSKRLTASTVPHLPLSSHDNSEGGGGQEQINASTRRSTSISGLSELLWTTTRVRGTSMTFERRIARCNPQD